MLGPFLGLPPLDRVREDVRDRLHEVDVGQAEPVELSSARPDHAEGLPLGLDQDDGRALHSLFPLELGLLEARLAAPVVDDDGAAGGERVAGLGSMVGGDPRPTDHLLRHPDSGDEHELIAARQELQNPAEVDVEDLGQDPAGLP